MPGHLSRPTLGSLSQGTIFACADAEDYEGCNIRGIVITARCDIAQSKAPVYNFLPVVSIDDWIHRDGRVILCDRLLKATSGKMKSCLRAAGHSESILVTQSPSNILNVLFHISGSAKPAKGPPEQFSRLVLDHDRITACMNSKPNDNEIVKVGDAFAKDRDGLVRELTEHRLNGFYFLPSVLPEEREAGYVVLLRQVQHMGRTLAARVAAGLAAEEYLDKRNGNLERYGTLSFAAEDFAMPVGVLRSPYIEHLMQVFSSLFSRIGLPDLDRDYLDRVWDEQPSVQRKRNEIPCV